MTEIVNAPVSNHSLLYQDGGQISQNQPSQGTGPTAGPSASVFLATTQTSTSSSRGLSAATLGLTRPRGSGGVEADLVLVRQILDDLRSDLKTNELFSNAERRTTALGDVLAVMQSLVENLERANFLEADTEPARIRTQEARLNYDAASLTAGTARGELTNYVTNVFDPLNELINDAKAENVTLGARVELINNTLLPNERLTKSTAESQLGTEVNPAPGTIRFSLAASRAEVQRIDALVAAEPDPAKKEAIRLQNNYAYHTGEVTRLSGLETASLTTISTATQKIGELEQEASTKTQQIQTNTVNIATWEDRMRTEVVPERARLQGIVDDANAVELVMKGRFDTADNYEQSIPGQLAIALGEFNAALAVIGVFIARLSTGSGSLEGGLEAELLSLKQGNLGSIRELSTLLEKARDVLINDNLIKDAIKDKTNDLGEIRKTKVTLAFSAIFTSLQDALNNLANALDPSINAPEKNGRLRFSIGGAV